VIPLGRRLRAGWRWLAELYDELFFARWRAAVARERRARDDLFLLLCFSDLLGIPNPVNHYTLELLPAMLESFHRWHLAQGLERSPLEGFR
jgi:hypothetical protein